MGSSVNLLCPNCEFSVKACLTKFLEDRPEDKLTHRGTCSTCHCAFGVREHDGCFDWQTLKVLEIAPVRLSEGAFQKEDAVNHPSHYTKHPSGIECIQITEHFNFNVGNAIKYLWRAGLKNERLEDLEKALWYVKREIDRAKKGPVTDMKEAE